MKAAVQSASDIVILEVASGACHEKVATCACSAREIRSASDRLMMRNCGSGAQSVHRIW